MKRQPLGLFVLLVPAEVEPAQAFEDRSHRGFGVALDVGIVEAQDHRPALVAGVEPVENEGARAADVQKAGRRRRKTDSQHNCQYNKRLRGEFPVERRITSRKDAQDSPTTQTKAGKKPRRGNLHKKI